MDTNKVNIGYLIGIGVASLYSLYYAFTPTEWHFIDYANLIFHEAGHGMFMFFGEFTSTLMGSGVQILLPFFISLYFFFKDQKISAGIVLMWTGFNLINVSIYAGDALTRQLPLLGGDNVIHDWNYLLSSLNLLPYTAQVAGIFYALGFIAIGTGIVLSFLSALKK
jgi:hypothetical protein